MASGIQGIFLDTPDLKADKITFSQTSNIVKIDRLKTGKSILRIIPLCAKLELVARANFARAPAGM